MVWFLQKEETNLEDWFEHILLYIWYTKGTNTSSCDLLGSHPNKILRIGIDLKDFPKVAKKMINAYNYIVISEVFKKIFCGYIFLNIELMFSFFVFTCMQNKHMEKEKGFDLF